MSDLRVDTSALREAAGRLREAAEFAARSADPVPGHPADVALPARELRRFGEGAGRAADELRGLTLGGWQGQAATASAHEPGEVPKRLDTTARRLRRGRAGADLARRPARPGAGARGYGHPPLAGRRGPLEGAAAPADAAPGKPGFLSRPVDGLTSFGAGAVEARGGLAELGYKLSPACLAADPQGCLNNLERLGKGIAYGVKNRTSSPTCSSPSPRPVAGRPRGVRCAARLAR